MSATASTVVAAPAGSTASPDLLQRRFGHQVPLASRFSGRARGCALLRRSVGVGIERRALYATEIRKANHGTLTNPLFRCVIVSVPAFCHWSASGVRSDQVVATFKGGYIMLKILTAAAASFAMLSAAAAADLPRREPPPPAPAPVGKYPVGKYPIGKYPPPAPVVTKG